MSTAHIFNELYKRYDSWYKRHPLLAYSELYTVSRALEGSQRPCVEIGVGTGWFASKLGCDLGVDPSLGMLIVARRRNLEVIAGIGESLPLRSSRFATVLLIVTLCFVDDPERVMLEASRILVSNGTLVTCIIPRDSEWGQYYLERSSKGHPFYKVARFYTVDEVDELALRSGFKRDKAYAALTYTPGTEAVEPPRSYRGGEGFVCLRYLKQ